MSDTRIGSPDERDRTDRTTVEAVRSVTETVDGPADLSARVDRIGEKPYVLIGEASHGTSEFYRWRAWMTARLIRDHGFSFVAVEGDWTDCYEVNRYVKGHAGAETARDVLRTFERWPTWMWANWEVLEFIEWLATFNSGRPTGERVGFYGLDVYGLLESMRALIEYLDDVDPEAAAAAREAYRCFEPYGEDASEYARALRFVPESCEDEVVELLTDLLDDGRDYDDERPDERFSAEQNAYVARNAEEYYRAMVGGHADSWNIRDSHMMDTLDRLVEHHGPGAKGIVWAHNTHVGDARATDMVRHGRHNIGQLARERAGPGDVELVGFGTHRGTVIAGKRWGAPMEEVPVPSARSGSVEALFHRAGGEDRLLVSDEPPAGSGLREERGHRAIGVVYDPGRESGNYVPTVLPDRYDTYVHVDETEALHPLAIHASREAVPALYPWGL